MAQHIICVGAVYIDTILNIPHFPIEDDKLRASSLVRRRGGNTANTLEVLSQLIMRVKTSSPQSMLGTPTILHLLSVLPMEDSDAFKFIQSSLPDVRMENSGIFRQGHKEAAQSFILRNEEDKENITRTIVSFNGLREMDILEFIARVRLLEMAEDARHGWYHFEGRIPEVTLDCIWHLRSDPASSDFKISVECEKPERQGMAEVAKEADLVFYSKIWAEKNGFNDAENFLKEQTKVARDGAILCCTWGAAGAAAVHKVSNNHREWATVNGWRPSTGAAPVIDTVGAGDTFIAGMLFALVNFKDEPLQQKLEFANEIAGRKVIQEGFGGLGFQMEMDFNRARSSSRTALENS